MNTSHPRALGLWRSWALVAGMMIGSGIFTLPSLLASYGSYSFLGWAVTGFGALCLALTYAHLAAKKAGLGGPYFYVQQAFGRHLAGLVAWGYWFSLVAAVSAVALSFAGYCANYFPSINTSPLNSSLFAMGVVLIFMAINLRGVREASVVQLVATVLKILPLVIVGILGIIFGSVESIPAVMPKENTFFSMLSSLCLLIMWAFIGVESATLPSEDTLTPEKTIPRASILGTLTATVVYVIATLGLMSVLSLEELSQSSYPFALAAKQLLGHGGEMLVTFGALFAIGGTLNVCLMMSGTMMLAGARDGIFPNSLQHQDEQGTPRNALIVSSAASICLLLMNISESLLKGFEYLIILSTFAVLMVYLATGLASLTLQWRARRTGISTAWPQVVTAALATGFSILAIIGAWVIYQ
jgi:APA family basic amino acid/polyamine antiporter